MTRSGLHCAKIALAAEGTEIAGAKPRQGAEVKDSDNSPGILECYPKEG